MDLKGTKYPWIAASWQAAVEAVLEPGETPLAAFEPDLDERLHFSAGVVLLTDRRVVAAEASSQSAPPSHPAWRSWHADGTCALRAKEHGGVGSLDLLGPAGQLAQWRYTASRGAAVLRLVQRFEATRHFAHVNTSEDAGSAACPSCGVAIPGDLIECPTCAPAPAPKTVSSLLRLMRFTRNRIGMIVLGFVLTLASTAAGLVPPYLTMPLLDRVLIPHQNGKPVDFRLVYFYLAGLAGAAVLAWVLSWIKTYVLAWVSERISADIRNQTYSHLQELSLEFFGAKRTGDLMARVGTDSDRICYFLSLNLLDFSSDVLMIGMTAAILVSINWKLAIVTLVPFPFIGWLIHAVRQHLRRGFSQGGRAWGELTSVLADTIPGIRVVKAFAQEKREVERFHRANDHVLAANDRVNRTWSFFGPMVTLLTEMGLLTVWAFGVWQVSHDEITVGVLTLFLAYITRFYSRLESMSKMVSAVQRAGASAQRIFEILDRVPSVAEPVKPVHLEHVEGGLEFQNVSFRYGAREVLHGVNLSIRPGEMIGLVGPSGAGKSTLVNLVCRFCDVEQGSIRLDGVDLRSMPISEYRRNIGIVLQEPFLFYGTIAENIAYGRPDATREEIIAAARAARAHEFILRLADGYDSLVGERGQRLSGGERQRISIARALLIDPKILILDEATSSVDTETELEIQEALDNLIRGRTTIAIAHRLSTLRRADRLVVLERGRIAEMGRHSDLLQNTGAYYRLHQAQLELAQG